MSKVYFVIGLHFHQPVGNFDEILDRSYNNCYKPFLDVFEKYPSIKISFHFSGNLLDYFEERHPEFLDRVKELVERGQVEILGGGYYEPIFQAIPQRDRLGQIEMLSDYSERRFGIRPKGMWIPERIWSPDLISDMVRCGIRYSILDDIHLIKSGVKQEEMYGYFAAGHDDKKVAIFPSSKTLRYKIPFKDPRETVEYFRAEMKRGKGKREILFTYGDDGEKFGEWPWTYDWVYKKGWLNNFFKLLTRHQDWIEITTFSEYLDSHSPLKEVDILEASYEEMFKWSEGSWMNFLSKYPESNQMHKRMIYVSERIQRLVDNGQLEEARKELYKGQCNCGYWHGVFGGIYLHHLRSAVYEHLIKADKIACDIEHKDENDWLTIKEHDFYNNGAKAAILENKDFFIGIDPNKGGVIRELDYKLKSVNLINTLARRRESYHKKIIERINNKRITPLEPYETIKTMNAEIKKGIYYDSHDRVCLVDHFIDKDFKMDDFINCNYIDRGDFADNAYVARIDKEKVLLIRKGNIEGKSLKITKEIYISSDVAVEVSYSLENLSSSTIATFFGMEFNISLPYANSDRYRYEIMPGAVSPGEDLGGLDMIGLVSQAKSFSIKDSKGGLGVELLFSEVTDQVWYFPVRAVSQSERSYDLNYQASCIFPVWDINLEAGEETGFTIKWVMV